MSITPTTPNLSPTDRAFWFKKDSLAGWAILAGIGVAGLMLWGSILPYLISMMADTVHLGILACEAVALGWVLFSKKSHMLFRLLSRKITNLFIPVFALDILDDKVAQMKKRREVMNEQISAVSGSRRTLRDVIAKNASEAEQRMKQADYAKRHIADAKDQAEAMRLQLRMKTDANKAGRRERANIGYQDLLKKIDAVYDMLTKWAVHIDAFIEDTEDAVQQEKIRYKTINAAYSAYKTALSVVMGNATEDDIYNRDLEFLAEDASRKLGEMEDFQRVAQDFMDNLDVQNGVVTEDALAKLNEYQQKVLTPGTQDTAFLLQGSTQVPIPIQRVNTGTDGNKYADLFKN